MDLGKVYRTADSISLYDLPKGVINRSASGKQTCPNLSRMYQGAVAFAGGP